MSPTRTTVRQLDDGSWWYYKPDGTRRSRAVVRNCATCGVEFGSHKSSNTRFCGRDCWTKNCKRCGDLFHNRTPRVEYCSDRCKFGTALCESCGEEFQVTKRSQGRFCSTECFYESVVPTGSVKDGYNGYLIVKVPPGTPGARKSSTMRRWMFQHRFVMQEHLGRPLEPNEQVHHINGDRADNRIENLELWKLSQPAGVRSADYHCPGCRCSME